MSGETILSWNVANWITVVLMAVLGFAVIGLITNGTKKKAADNAAG
jgi:hypothetical protein